MRIVARRTLIAFGEKHPESKAALQHWINVAKAARWQSTQDVVGTFSKAKRLNRERVRFEITGGGYRMIAAFDFGRQTAFIKFIGTHDEYDKIDAKTVSKF